MNEEEILNEIDFCLAGEYITIEHRQAIEGLLASYNQEKEKNKKLEEEKEAFARSYAIARDEEADNYFLMSKVIDMMAEEITDFTGSCPADIFNKEWDEQEGDCEHCKSTDKECFIKYYFKKARGEGDGQVNI